MVRTLAVPPDGPLTVHRRLPDGARPQAPASYVIRVGGRGDGRLMTTLTARSPVDLLAAAPVVLGFVPEESLVMLTFGARRPFHARVCLPRSPDERAEVTHALLAPVLEHGVTSVALLLYDRDAEPAGCAARHLAEALQGRGVDVVDVIRADGCAWWRVRPDGGEEHGGGYDVRHHPFVAQSVVEGHVLLDSREALAATLDREPDRAAEVAAAVPQHASPEEAWRLLLRLVEAGAEPPGPVDARRLLEAVGDARTRDLLLGRFTRERARELVELWSGLVRGAPEDLRADAAAVLALAAWLAGQGALAWCGVDAARELEPQHRLAAHVALVLEHAVPPAAWEQTHLGSHPHR